DDDQPEILELDAVLNQFMRTNDDVDLALAECGQGSLLLLARAEPRQFGDLYRPVGETVAKRLVVLFGEQSGRDQNCHLLVVHHADKSCPQRYLGFAETDVAAHQPVHRLAGGEIAHYRIDGGLLVARLFEWKTVGEGLVVLLLESKGITLARSTLRIDVQ